MREAHKGLLKGIPVGLICLLLMIIFSPHAAAAEHDSLLWISPVLDSSSGEENTAIHWFYARDRKYYLYLPSHSPAESLALWFTGEDSLTVEQDGRVIHSGDSAAWLEPGKEYTLTGSKKSVTLAVMQSANIPALFITTASGSLPNGLYVEGRLLAGQYHGFVRVTQPDGSSNYEERASNGFTNAMLHELIIQAGPFIIK